MVLAGNVLNKICREHAQGHNISALEYWSDVMSHIKTLALKPTNLKCKTHSESVGDNILILKS